MGSFTVNKWINKTLFLENRSPEVNPEKHFQVCLHKKKKWQDFFGNFMKIFKY